MYVNQYLFTWGIFHIAILLMEAHEGWQRKVTVFRTTTTSHWPQPSLIPPIIWGYRWWIDSYASVPLWLAVLVFTWHSLPGWWYLACCVCCPLVHSESCTLLDLHFLHPKLKTSKPLNPSPSIPFIQKKQIHPTKSSSLLPPAPPNGCFQKIGVPSNHPF